MPKKILLADDSITIQKVVELTFSDGDYEVTAVNNGAKAIQKLSESRPDIILSDIIMPEKNGYEVCEYVKSHPEYRNIPVVLLTGTFEPFDPDRAEKAGCDAVVTKPFESQSLIHKVEELISQAASAPAAPAPPAASPWEEEAPAAGSPTPFSTSGGSVPIPGFEPPPAHDSDIFGAAPAPQAPAAMPFESPAESPFGAPPDAEAFSGETRAFPRMSFEDMQKMAASSAPQPDIPPAPEPSPWDEQPEIGGETSILPPMSFDQAPLETAPQQEPAAETSEPFDAPPPADAFSGETRAFPQVTFDQLQQMASERTAEPQQSAEPSPWAENPPQAPAFGTSHEPPAFESSPEPPAFGAPEAPTAAESPSPWDEGPAFGGETRAFPRMSFDEMQKMAGGSEAPAERAPEPAGWEAPAEPAGWEAPAEPAWSLPTSEPSTLGDFSTPSSPFAEPAQEELPSAAAQEEAQAPAEEPMWAPAAEAEAAAEPAEPPVSPAVLAPEAPAMPIARGELTDEQVDRIARRVVELMSEQVVRNIAWEVIPDMAEMVVKERIRQLESEA